MVGISGVKAIPRTLSARTERICNAVKQGLKTTAEIVNVTWEEALPYIGSQNRNSN